MEGTLEEPPIKDSSQASPDKVLKDVIPNGVNGDYNDKEEFIDADTNISKLVSKEISSVVREDREANGKEDEEDKPRMEVEIEERGLKSENSERNGITQSRIKGSEMSESENGSKMSKSSEGVSEMNNFSEVSKTEDKCKNTSCEAMEVDEQSNNSDVECLDESITEIHSDNDDVFTMKNSALKDNKNLSGSSDIQLNDSSEIADSSMDTSDVKICEENGSCDSPDIEEITDSAKNGHNTSPERANKDPKQRKSRKQVDLSSITPRRSSRNIKRTSYIEKEIEEEEVDDDGSDIEEIKPEDPLAGVDSKDKENSKLKSPVKNSKTTIVVNDTKRLVEIAAGSKSVKGGKKEPTLVIIDTNSILSGRGGVPVSNSKPHHTVSSTSSFSVVPMGMTTQPMYSNMRTTITPVPMTSKTAQLSPKTTSMTTVTPTVTPPILPTLTDDMFVVEAPSFIVPYVYEKPPLKPLKEFVTKLEKCLEEQEKEERSKRCTEENKGEEYDEDSLDVSQKNKDKSEESDNEGNCKGKKEEDRGDNSLDITDSGFNNISDKQDIRQDDRNKVLTYFDLPLGKFFMQIGVNLVQEYVQTDLLRTQKRKQGKGSTSAETQLAINSLIKNLEFSKENNEPFHLELKKCEFCNFKTESTLVMQHHLETPHMRNYVYKCNFCPVEVRSPHDILFHMEAEHNTRGRLERGPAFHQCPNCPFEDNQKGKLTRHILACTKKFRPEKNLEPAADWEPPAKIPRLNRTRPVGPTNPSALAMAMSGKGPQPLLPKLLPASATGRGRGRPPMQPRYSDLKTLRPGGTTMRQDNVAGMMYRPTSSGLLVPTSYQFGSNQIFQVVGGSGTVMSAVSGVSSSSGGSSGQPTPIALVPNVIDSLSRLSSSQNTTASPKNPTAKLLSQPSISITPLPRTTSQTSIPGSGTSSKSGGKTTFVICEICDGYIKDLEQLRNHMQWIHKVKIHPKMIYNRPPLNCQKCQFRFFTDQGLERHLLGSHGLVTSSMQEAANRGKDAGRCPACGRVYQWKLLNHVARDHGMTLKPAHLSYKCTVCTATFGMYKQFENHVYSAHSVVAKRVMDKKNTPSSPSSRSNDSLLKPLKINDEITIIPQPAKPTTRSGTSQGRGK
ncbi:PREDICTED: MOG interacting and ectopic P-granules protein 1 isoform X1 [Eufriesea mexicana]|nr:PREDICTED: MOG interacting and ectopic P-granules protein 1 isoform X1 [Eufriesea mexicana]XP_017764917.1 PREDICTED: MOG interacting and ectopic P-granules protein 1 isoform X1 [Eufriesea mexicana]XP_017764918.1 PREDICTED: MOG interacting and ectopic P-granules protein 1 isoform X1 [Eufriesea mexicana]XP_017764920.1 PREDICTED: MOG interacting and ectopic P-granules protein 1 isoform X1 [Eufriesea mexicana]XP_017764921.1 PREDICTED: MOG interacting and ectopic P-granules protein 1 isoform X1 [